MYKQDRHYAYWLPCGITRQFFELLDGRIRVPNPGAENQVSVRAYRIGQKCPVTIDKLISDKKSLNCVRRRKILPTLCYKAAMSPRSLLQKKFWNF